MTGDIAEVDKMGLRCGSLPRGRKLDQLAKAVIAHGMHTGRSRPARCHECSEGRTAPETTKPTDESLSSVGFFFVGGTAALHAAF